jgi:hypothetical protein
VLFDDEHRNPFYSFDELIMYELMTGPDGNVPFGNVVAAFTEDYDPHAAEGGRSVLQKELYARIAEAWRGFDTVSAIIYGELGMGVDRNKNYDTHYGMIYSFMNTRSRLIATAPFNQP